MPYISASDRPKYEKILTELAALIPQDRLARPGHINYVVSALLDRIYGEKLRYADHNEVVGVLNCIALEFYRRRTAPYEDEKIRDEGDIR